MTRIRSKPDIEKEIKHLLREIDEYPELWRKRHQEEMCPVMDNPSVYYFDRVLRINMLLKELEGR